VSDARLFHITTQAALDAARVAGVYRAASLETEGFIHLSTREQWRGTHERFFRGQHGLVLLEIAPERLDAEVRFEPADGQLFPHLFGALPMKAVVAVHPLPSP